MFWFIISLRLEKLRTTFNNPLNIVLVELIFHWKRLNINTSTNRIIVNKPKKMHPIVKLIHYLQH